MIWLIISFIIGILLISASALGASRDRKMKEDFFRERRKILDSLKK